MKKIAGHEFRITDHAGVVHAFVVFGEQSQEDAALYLQGRHVGIASCVYVGEFEDRRQDAPADRRVTGDPVLAANKNSLADLRPIAV